MGLITVLKPVPSSDRTGRGLLSFFTQCSHGLAPVRLWHFPLPVAKSNRWFLLLLLLLFEDRVFLCQPWLSWRSGWPPTHRDLSASELKACATQNPLFFLSKNEGQSLISRALSFLKKTTFFLNFSIGRNHKQLMTVSGFFSAQGKLSEQRHENKGFSFLLPTGHKRLFYLKYICLCL